MIPAKYDTVTEIWLHMDELASMEFTVTIDKIKITFAMLAALFIALIGIASHMSIQVFFLCALLGIISPLLTFRCQQKQRVSPPVLSHPHVQQIQRHSWICKGAMRSFPLYFFMAMVDKYYTARGGVSALSPRAQSFATHPLPHVPIVCVPLSEASGRLDRCY